jgi:hypothetical protein
MSSFFCEKCQYNTDVKQNYSKHLLSKRHIITPTTSITTIKETITIYKCKCKKEFKSYSGLWRHKKKCETVNPTNNNNETNDILIEKIDKLENLIIELGKNQVAPITNNNNNQNNFTILNILNANYKNVISFEEFIKNITIDFEDIKDITDKESCIECVNHIIVNRLKDYQINERPFHCIMDEDENAETFVKNKEWIKEYVKDYDDNTPILEDKVVSFIVKVNQDIENMEIEKDVKQNLKKILKGITKRDNIKDIKNGLFYGIHINKYELNHNLLESDKNIVVS